MIRTRIAPSPTGELHVGSVATALKNWAFARRHGGQFIIRIEDTDRERLVAGATERTLSLLKTYGLDWDEGPDIGGPFGPYTQSERLTLYQEKAEELVQRGQAYYCFATPEELEEIRQTAKREKRPPRYDGRYREYPLDAARDRIEAGEPYVIRLKVPEKTIITVEDGIRGSVAFNSAEISDQILLKSDGFPTYHLAVVVDDHLMQITHVIRGEEWLTSTPKHVLLYQAFGWELPTFIHIPVFLNPEGKGKMSKRKGTVSAQSFLDRGFLPEALLNFFMILGWSHPDQREIMDLNEYVSVFEPTAINKNSVAFDLKKLSWLNGHYIRALTPEELQSRSRPFAPAELTESQLSAILPLIHERIERLDQVPELTRFWYDPEPYDLDTLLRKSEAPTVSDQLAKTRAALSELEPWSADTIEAQIRQLQTTYGWSKKQYFMLIRYASTTATITPPLFETLAVMGKALVLERLSQAQENIP